MEPCIIEAHKLGRRGIALMNGDTGSGPTTPAEINPFRAANIFESKPLRATCVIFHQCLSPAIQEVVKCCEIEAIRFKNKLQRGAVACVV